MTGKFINMGRKTHAEREALERLDGQKKPKPRKPGEEAKEALDDRS